ncbi:hypothetical protein [Mycolicibacterium sp. 018/SC-01/001]|uniref:hypothetical protein n=1 Tax=Mycolicibacterium sp. 018/SC-01/001 TaxID=2592069 RepID=UPI00117D7463|nr:hypothetical protein [Mycolicibacterium sp. 018/SC-01/001]
MKIFAGLWLGGMGLFILIVGIHYLSRGEVPSAFVALCGAAFCFGFAAPQVKVVAGRVIPRIQSDSSGTLFRPDRGIELPMQAALGGGVLACLLILILLPMGRLAIPVPPNMRYSLPFMAAVISASGLPILWRNIRRGSVSHLRLTAEGFEILQGWRPRCADWDSVKDIGSEVPNRKAQTPSTIVFILSDDSVQTFTASAYTPDGTALKELVRFYWQHPEARDELTDGRASQRLLDKLGAA